MFAQNTHRGDNYFAQYLTVVFHHHVNHAAIVHRLFLLCVAHVRVDQHGLCHVGRNGILPVDIGHSPFTGAFHQDTHTDERLAMTVFHHTRDGVLSAFGFLLFGSLFFFLGRSVFVGQVNHIVHQTIGDGGTAEESVQHIGDRCVIHLDSIDRCLCQGIAIEKAILGLFFNLFDYRFQMGFLSGQFDLRPGPIGRRKQQRQR